MKKTFFERLLSFMLGASWALTLVFAFYLFELFLIYSFSTALVAMLMGLMFGLFFILILEYILFKIHAHHEQSELLKQILEHQQKPQA